MTRFTVSTGKPGEARNDHSAGVVVSGRFLFTSGLTPRDADGAVVGRGDMAAQMAQTFANVADVLRAAGTGFEHAIKFTIYVTDIDAYIAARAGLTEAAAAMAAGPASTLVEVSRLADPDMMVEIEAIAEIP